MASMITVRIRDDNSVEYRNLFFAQSTLSAKFLKDQIELLRDPWYVEVAITYIKENLR